MEDDNKIKLKKIRDIYTKAYWDKKIDKKDFRKFNSFWSNVLDGVHIASLKFTLHENNTRIQTKEYPNHENLITEIYLTMSSGEFDQFEYLEMYANGTKFYEITKECLIQLNKLRNIIITDNDIIKIIVTEGSISSANPLLIKGKLQFIIGKKDETTIFQPTLSVKHYKISHDWCIKSKGIVFESHYKQFQYRQIKINEIGNIKNPFYMPFNFTKTAQHILLTLPKYQESIVSMEIHYKEYLLVYDLEYLEKYILLDSGDSYTYHVQLSDEPLLMDKYDTKDSILCKTDLKIYFNLTPKIKIEKIIGSIILIGSNVLLCSDENSKPLFV